MKHLLWVLLLTCSLSGACSSGSEPGDLQQSSEGSYSGDWNHRSNADLPRTNNETDAPDPRTVHGENSHGCQPNCIDNSCGDDGCGGSCGGCSAPSQCLNGFCQEPGCVPDCDGKSCGPNACGGSCGNCPENQSCLDGICAESSCTSQCSEKECGPDGCGNSCGSCDPGYECEEGSCTYNPCNDDPCSTPPNTDIPLLCTPGESCFSDQDCPKSTWMSESQCSDGKCRYDGLRSCANSDNCLQWCRDFYAETYETLPSFSYCEDQYWECSQATECPDSQSICKALPKCNSSNDCVQTWMSQTTCKQGKCLAEPLTCEVENDCYEHCRSFYASTYDIDPSYSFCEDRFWTCSEPNGCENKAKTCTMHIPCSDNHDCESQQIWITQESTCEDGKCVTGFKPCETPALCYDSCTEFYEEAIGSGVEWTYCEDQIWTCE